MHDRVEWDEESSFFRKRSRLGQAELFLLRMSYYWRDIKYYHVYGNTLSNMYWSRVEISNSILPSVPCVSTQIINVHVFLFLAIDDLILHLLHSPLFE